MCALFYSGFDYMKRAFFAALTMLAAPAMAEQTVAHHFATLEYQRIIDGCQMYRLNTPQGATLLFGQGLSPLALTMTSTIILVLTAIWESVAGRGRKA